MLNVSLEANKLHNLRLIISVCYNKLGDIAEQQGKLNLALEYYEKGLKLREAIFNETHSRQSYDDLAVSFYKNAGVRNDKALYRKAYSIWVELAKTCPDIPEFARRRDIVLDILSD